MESEFKNNRVLCYNSSRLFKNAIIHINLKVLIKLVASKLRDSIGDKVIGIRRNAQRERLDDEEFKIPMHNITRGKKTGLFKCEFTANKNYYSLKTMSQK